MESFRYKGPLGPTWITKKQARRALQDAIDDWIVDRVTADLMADCIDGHEGLVLDTFVHRTVPAWPVSAVRDPK